MSPDIAHSVVKGILGNIIPTGVSEIDNERFKNLHKTETLVDLLLTDIREVASMKSSEASVKKASDEAKKFLEDLKELA